MPSSNKTLHLQLNKWLGSDKPKKDDFNNDNQKIDEACRLLEQSIGLLESAALSNASANEQAHGIISSSLSSHIGNSDIHLTQDDKENFNKSGVIIGSYQGDGKSSQKITLGFAPSFVLVFPVGEGLARVNWTGEMFAMNTGCATTLGSSVGMTLNSDGFTVEYQSVGGFDGFQIKYNAPSVQYIYLACKG